MAVEKVLHSGIDTHYITRGEKNNITNTVKTIHFYNKNGITKTTKQLTKTPDGDKLKTIKLSTEINGHRQQEFDKKEIYYVFERTKPWWGTKKVILYIHEDILPYKLEKTETIEEDFKTYTEKTYKLKGIDAYFKQKTNKKQSLNNIRNKKIIDVMNENGLDKLMSEDFIDEKRVDEIIEAMQKIKKLQEMDKKQLSALAL